MPSVDPAWFALDWPDLLWLATGGGAALAGKAFLQPGAARRLCRAQLEELLIDLDEDTEDEAGRDGERPRSRVVVDREEVARALGEEEKRELAAALAEALHRLRHPVFENPHLDG